MKRRACGYEVHGAGRVLKTKVLKLDFKCNRKLVEGGLSVVPVSLAALWRIRIPGTGESDGLTSMGLHRVGHD